MSKFKQNKRFYKPSIIGCIAVLCSLWSTSWCAKIVYPWRATTAIVKPNETFEVWFSADSGQNLNSVQLKGPYNTVTAVITATNTTTWTYDQLSGNTCNRKYTVKVPSGAPADRYDLVLKTSTGDKVSEKAVKVVKEYKSDYYVMHISDSHMYQGTLADKLVVPNRRDLLMKIANILDVEILVETGDLVYGSWISTQLNEYLNGPGTMLGANETTAAVFLTPGDHDAPANDYPQNTQQANAAHWNTYFGLHNHSFKYGNGRYMMLNNGWGTQTYQTTAANSWLSGAGSGGNFRVTAAHSYDKMHKTIHDVNPLKLVLAGDKHSVRSFNPFELDGDLQDADGDYYGNGTAPEVAYIAASVGYYLEYNLFRVSNSAGTFTKPSGPTASTPALSSGNIDTPSTWVPALALTYTGSNAGTLTSNTAKITNRYGFKIYGAKARFIMKRGTYTVNTGTIHQQFDGSLSGVNVTVVDVNVDVAANTTASVIVSAGGSSQVTVPNVMNLTEASAKSSITGAGLTVSGVSSNYHATVAAGLIYSQTPGGGTLVAPGSSVALAVSKGQGASLPVVSFIAPTNLTLQAGSTLYVKVGATDPEGISVVRLYKDGVQLDRSEGGAPYEWNATGQTDLELQNLATGSFVLTAKATDTAGSVGEKSITINVAGGIPSVGSIITMKAVNGKYVSATYSTNNTLIANKTTLSNYERFKVVNATNSIALQCMGNSKFVSIDALNGSKPMVANRASIGSYEKFQLVQSGSQIAIRSVTSTNYASAVSNGVAPLQANQTYIGSYEKFTWKVE